MLLPSWVAPSEYWCLRVFLPKGRTLHASLFRRASGGSFQPIFQPVQVPRHGSATLWNTSLSSQFDVICRPAEHAPCPIIQLVNEDDWTGKAKAEPRRPFTFLAARAHCWLMFSLVSTRTPSSCSEKLLPNGTGPSIDPWGTPPVTGLQQAFVPLTTTLWASSQLTSHPHLLVSAESQGSCQLQPFPNGHTGRVQPGLSTSP